MILEGCIGKTESRYTPTGKLVTVISLATYAGGKGETKKTVWVRVTIWENEDSKSLSVGDCIKITGMFEHKDNGVNYFTGKDGKIRMYPSIVADEFSIIKKKGG